MMVPSGDASVDMIAQERHALAGEVDIAITDICLLTPLEH